MNEAVREWVVDKTDWIDGPWMTEPDKDEWRDEATGLVCLAVRSDITGAWCGYVGIPHGHPLYGLEASALNKALPFGEINFAQGCHVDSPVCHVPAEGESDNVWWAGFDLAHFNDLAPRIESLEHIYAKELPGTWPSRPLDYKPYGTYKTLPYVRSACAQNAQAVVDAS